jgi:hypothetical protein
MSDSPVVIAEKVTRASDCWLLKIRCPHCGKRHTHGGGPLDEPPTAGHVQAHCRKRTPESDRGYVIELPEKFARSTS